MPQLAATKIMVDNSNVLTLVQNLLSTNKVRHIKRRELVVREREVDGDIETTKCDTSDNLSDLMTKVLDRDPFEKLRVLCMQLVRVGVTMSTFLPAKHRARLSRLGVTVRPSDHTSVATE